MSVLSETMCFTPFLVTLPNRHHYFRNGPNETFLLNSVYHNLQQHSFLALSILNLQSQQILHINKTFHQPKV